MRWHLAKRPSCALLLPALLVFSPAGQVSAQRIAPSISLGAKQWATGGFTGGRLGWSVEGAIGLRSRNNFLFDLGLDRWQHRLGDQTWVLYNIFLRAKQTIGPSERTWRGVVGGRIGGAFYDQKEFSEPFSGWHFGLEFGIERRVGSTTALQLVLQPAYVRFVDDPGGVSLGIGIVLTGRSPD